MAQGKRIVQIIQENNLNDEEADLVRFFVDDYLPTTLHEAMFIPVIATQGSEEQVKKW